MRKSLLLFFLVAILSACGKGKSPKAIAREICDCSKKANALPVSDPNRSNAQNDCLKRQGEEWAKLKDDVDKAFEYSDELSKCASEVIKEAFK